MSAGGRRGEENNIIITTVCVDGFNLIVFVEKEGRSGYRRGGCEGE